MAVTLYQIDAFADEPFSGNPAAVCLLEREAADSWMGAVAAEMNLSETAFVVPQGDAFGLRWYTPAIEVKLCGHATLAAAHALWEDRRVGAGETIRFRTASGVLPVRRRGNLIEMDFPAIASVAAEPPGEALTALGVAPCRVERTEDTDRHQANYLIELGTRDDVAAVRPDYRRLGKQGAAGFIVTAPSGNAGHDYVARFFAPAFGIDEDPVTGSAHSLLGPYWGARLGRTELTGYQASARGGVVHVRLDGGRAHLAGRAVTVATGRLTVPVDHAARDA